MRSWLKLLLGCLALIVFVKMVPEVLNNISAYRVFTEYAEEAGIDPTALFYTDEPHTADAEKSIRESVYANTK